jgi:CheY-like chemotaxis protein
MNLNQLNILLADDDTDDRFFFEEALKDFPISTRLTTVPNGEHLMHLLITETNQLPDVIFLDLNMPRKNGFECLSELKLNKKLKEIPVIIYSKFYHKKIADLLYLNGATYYISKPSEISQLKKVVQQLITLIAQGNILQPAQEKFVLAADEKNYQEYLWFKNSFTIPFAENMN